MTIDFDTKFAELQTIVKKLESGTSTLEEALVLFEQGTKLAKELESYIKDAERRMTIEVINGDKTAGHR